MVIIWLFDSRGFISAVAYDPSKDSNKSSKFSSIAKQAGTHVLIRARIEEDLDMLKTVVPNLHVETDPSADYSFRAVVTRKQYKKFLVQAVDHIIYDSHFKEAAQKYSPKAEGRYTAMMSVWSAMAKLQPIRPYSGLFSAGGVSNYSKPWKKAGATTPTKSNLQTSSAAPKVNQGAKDMQDFISKAGDLDGKPHRLGEGPRTGFAAGDIVEGYFGFGVVKGIRSRPSNLNGAELVDVTFQRDGKDVTSSFVSNYLTPVLDTVAEADGEGIIDAVPTTLEEVFDALLVAKSPQWNLEELHLLDESALELVICVGERVEDGDEFSPTIVREEYEKVMWQYASDEEKIKMSEEGAVPEKYEAEVLRILADRAVDENHDEEVMESLQES